MLKEYGVKDTKAEELFAIDFTDLKDDDGLVQGIIFVSEYQDEPLTKEWENEDPDEDEIVFTSQVVTNACGTFALMNIVLNSEIKEKGEIINNFNEFTKGFSFVNRGLCLGNSEEIRRIHNSYSPANHKADNLNIHKVSAESSEQQNGVFTDEYEKEYHYIAYIYKNARPYKIRKCKQEEWLKQTEALIQNRMDALNEFDFSLMAIRHDNYDKIVTDTNILNTNIHSLDSICSNNTPLTQIEQNEPKEIEGLPFVAAAWKDVELKDFSSLKSHLEQLKEKHNFYSNSIRNIEDTRFISTSNVKRQKFDYFPFIDTIIRKAYKRGLIEDLKSRKKKKATAKKPAKKKRHSQQKVIQLVFNTFCK
ncbi:ubiquitin carboxyl-terminal hydrolase [Pilaira anomala]|nr:ubiquitin carboxyl-terminal hydrolase [Pilaira anomala]